jgi:hypothetical protein
MNRKGNPMASSNVAHIKVSVDSDKKVLRCTPDPVSVKNANALLVFELDNDDYKFPDTGAVVVATPGDDFPSAAWRVSPQLVTLYDENNDQVSYKYTVAVVDKDTGKLITLDPTIDNQP